MKFFPALAIVSALILRVAADYKYPIWSSLPQCAKNCFSAGVGASDQYGCDGKNITCTCLGPLGAPPDLFDRGFKACIELDYSTEGGCGEAPSDQDVDEDELLKYEHDIFCFLRNGTASGYDPATGSKLSSTMSITKTSSKSSSAINTAKTSSESTASSDFPTLATSNSDDSTSTSSSSTLTTSGQSTTTSSQSVHITTVSVVVTANTTMDMPPATSTATPSTDAAPLTQTSGHELGDASFKLTMAFVFFVGGMVLLI